MAPLSATRLTASRALSGLIANRAMSSRSIQTLFPSTNSRSPAPTVNKSFHVEGNCEGLSSSASSLRPPIASSSLVHASSRFPRGRKTSPRKPVGRLWSLSNGIDKSSLYNVQERSFFGPGMPFSPTPEACEHQERRLVRYCPEQVFHVVSSVEQYPVFLPWCKDAVVKSSKGNEDNAILRAEMSVGFRGLSESYISEVSLQKPSKIVVKAVDSRLFEEMKSEWQFSSGPDEFSCWLDFKVRFCFSNHIYNQVASMFQDEVAKTMIGAFEGRCKQLYGPPIRAGQPASRTAPAT